jgi:hypothetical protein
MLQRCLFYSLLITAFALAACQSDRLSDWNKVDLLSYGMPLSVYAPDSVKILSKDISGLMRDVSLRLGDDYFVQIYSAPAATNDLAQIKSEQLELVRENPYFKAIVEEKPDGFIFELSIDGQSSFGFRHVRYQGDREYIFQNGLSGIFTEEQVRKMYDAVRLE